MRLLLRMCKTSQALLDSLAYRDRQSGTSTILQVSLPLRDLVRPKWEGWRGQRVRELPEDPWAAPGSCGVRSGEEAHGPRRDPWVFYPRDWGGEASAGRRDAGTREFVLEGGAGLGCWDAATKNPEEDAHFAWTPGRGLCGRGRSIRCACVMGAPSCREREGSRVEQVVWCGAELGIKE